MWGDALKQHVNDIQKIGKNSSADKLKSKRHEKCNLIDKKIITINKGKQK